MKIKQIPLYAKILFGMFLGAVFALVLINFSFGAQFISDWIKPFGNIFISLLKLIAVPLILVSLIKGISDLKDISKLSKMGIKTISIYIVTTVIAVSIGLITADIIKPGNSISENTRTELLGSFSQDASGKISSAEEHLDSPPLQILIDIIPENSFSSLSSNKNMLQVIFISLLFGIAMVMLPDEITKPVKVIIDSLNEIVLKIIEIIMKFAPIGVFALIAAIIAETPDIEIFTALGFYSLCVILGLITIFIIYLLIVKTFTGVSPKKFITGMAPAQLLAFSTSSSAAALPVTMKCVEENLNVSKETAGFVLPIGATINMDGTSLYQAVAAVFIAQAYGIELSIVAQLGIILTATLASIGTAAVPGAGMVMLLIILTQAGIPEAGLALIFAIDRPLDMCRTVINVTGDSVVSLLIDRKKVR